MPSFLFSLLLLSVLLPPSFAQENCKKFSTYNISCSNNNNNQTIININGIGYRLLTDTTNNPFTLAPTTTISPNNCSSLPTQNTTLESSVLSYTDQTVNLTLYRCPPSPPSPPSPLYSQIGCSEDNPVDVSWFYLPLSYANTNIADMNCPTIILPVLKNATEGVLDEKWDWESFISAFEGGFEVNFISDKKKSDKKILAIALPVVFGFLVLAGLCFVCYKRRKGGKIIFRQTSSTRNSFIKTAAAFSLDHSKYSTEVDIESQSSSPYLKPPHIFTYKELDEATDGFHSDREIGDGGFGTVYKGFLRDGRTVAVKRLYENNHKRLEQFLNEVKIVEPLRHPNLVTLYGCTSHHSRELLLVYEFVCNGTVADHLHGPRASERVLTWPLRMKTAIGAADALAHLHAIEPPVIHRDVKTNNILLDDSFHVKVADFGLSRLFPLDATHVSTAPQGTPGYVDPDYYNCYQLTDKSDVYSLGVVLVELISSKPAVDITRKRQDINLSKMAIDKITKGLIHELADPELGYETDPEVKRQIQATAQVAFLCLQSDKDMRPPMKLVKTMLSEILTPPHDGPDGPPPHDGPDGPDADKKHSGLLEGPVSPDTVTSKWYSRVTTPNSSV